LKKRAPLDIIFEKPQRVKRKTRSLKERKDFIEAKAAEYLLSIEQHNGNERTRLVNEVCEYGNYGRNRASILLRSAAIAFEKSACSLLNT